MPAIAARATHIVAADLSYRWLTGNTYKITLVLYGDCGRESSGAFSTLPISTPSVCVLDGNLFFKSLYLKIEEPACGLEITQTICPNTITQCTDMDATVPGIKQFVYSDTVVLSNTSHCWQFIYTGYNGSDARDVACSGLLSVVPATAGRGYNITNILNAGNSILQLVDTLDNTFENNSSPLLTRLPTPYFCLQKMNCYMPVAVDRYDSTLLRPNGDSLSFALTAATQGRRICDTPGGPVTYTGNAWTYPTPQLVTGETPLTVDSARNFHFDPQTGEICFFPNALQRSDVVYNIREYRNGVFIGNCQREMTFLVQTCDISQPTGDISGATAGRVLSSSDYQICAGTGDFSVYMAPYDDDTSASIAVATAGLPAGSSFATTGNNTNHPQCAFNWTTNGVVPGVYTFSVTFTDNHCPTPGIDNRVFNIIQTSSFSIIPTVTNDICQQGIGSIKVDPNGGTPPFSYQWSTSGSGAILDSLLPGVYALTVRDNYGCEKKTAIEVKEDLCPAVIVHDVITPNGDGINDEWTIEGIQNYPANTVQLFDKWGDKVFEQTGYNNSWRGRGIKGELPDGTYYYIVKLNRENIAGGKNIFNGTLLIKR